ncbi:MAG: alpha/beta hydrolase [Anaerolinea sp.]|nr:alpha/beta hydrolase [Anaerolinea sp.]
MAYEMTVYNINDRQIFVREEGEGNRRGVALLIHGWSSSWFAMSPLMPLLRKRYRALAVDLPGYGQSPPCPGVVSIAWYADLLADLLRATTDKPAVLIGHSMGGMISLTMALRHPELVERVVLLCPTITGRLSLYINLFVSPVTFLERLPLISRLVGLLEPSLVGITDRLMRPAAFSERGGMTAVDYEHIRADVRNPAQGKVRAQCFTAMREGDLRQQLQTIKAPGLVIWGMEDNTVPLRDASILADEWPDADLRILPRVSHWPQFEARDLTLRYITAFLSTPLKLLTVDWDE